MAKLEHLEYLSKLKFPEEGREKFEKEFERILSFVDEITKLDLSYDLDKDQPIPLSQLREDEPVKSDTDVLRNAPKQKDGCYVTPMVVE